MIKKRTNANGVNPNVSLEPTAASSSTSNINNNIIINKREDGKEEIVITRDMNAQIEPEINETDAKSVILKTYAQILLNENKAVVYVRLWLILHHHLTCSPPSSGTLSLGPRYPAKYPLKTYLKVHTIYIS